MYNEHNCPGYGDSETWGRILDPRDPRYVGIYDHDHNGYDDYAADPEDEDDEEDYFDEPDEEDDLDSDDDYYYGD